MRSGSAGSSCSIRGMVPHTIPWVDGCTRYSCALSCWAGWEAVGIASMYLGGRFPVVKCMVHCDLFLVGNVAHVYNAVEQQGLLSESRGEDGHDGLEVDKAHRQDARRWDL